MISYILINAIQGVQLTLYNAHPLVMYDKIFLNVDAHRDEL